MLNIAICDDNKECLLNVTDLLNIYINIQRGKKAIKYSVFHNALDLIAAIESGQQYDLVLLDIIMPFMTGMDAAKEIRVFNQDVKIIFFTSSNEFAVESYSVGAYYYAIKPIGKETLFIILDRVVSEMETQINTSLLVKSTTGLTRIYMHRLEFAEVNGRTILYHLVDGSVIEATGSMTELEKLLTDICFMKPHRSYIINMKHINTLLQKEIQMQSLAVVPMSKANYSDIKSAYIKFAFM
jgi:DNA-binding LytR/AlgR family response regulator